VTNEELLELVKDTALKVAEREHPGDAKSMDALRAQIHERLTLDAPLSELGWDSARMTWLLVRLEERLNIDASDISLYELFTVGDLLERLRQRLPKDATNG
jgi:acyl carrier protein